MSKLTEAARGRDCQVRYAGVCNFNPETTVLAHYRMAGSNGMGIKPNDQQAAWACSDCHLHSELRDAETRLDFAHGVFRTQEILRREGKIK
jgi:hypothetical protein